MSRILIENVSSASDAEVVGAIQAVMLQGRISKNDTCYCYVTTFRHPEICVSASLTKAGADKFYVFDDKRLRNDQP